MCLTMRSTDNGKKLIRGVIAAAFWIAVWEAGALIVGQELILPSPLSVAKALYELAGEGEFWILSLTSMWRIISGLILGVALGTLAAVLTVRFRICDMLLSPLVKIIRTTPVASFIVLAMLWIVRTGVPGFIAALIVIPVVWADVRTAVMETDQELLEMGRAYGFGAFRTFRYIYLPSVLPSWNSAFLTALGLAWKSGIAAEVMCQPRDAIGTELMRAKSVLDMPRAFAWTVVVVVLCLILEAIFKRIMKGKVKV